MPNLRPTVPRQRPQRTARPPTVPSKVRRIRAQEALVWALAFSANGTSLASGCGSYGAPVKGTIEIWETATGKKSRELAGHLGAIGCLAFSEDGRSLASGVPLKPKISTGIDGPTSFT